MSYFRPMQEDDLKTVVEIEFEANDFPWTLQKIQDSTSSHDCWVCCLEESTEIVAYAIVSSVLDESDLLNLCVSRKYQGQGYGRKLLEHLLGAALDSEQKTIFLEVRATNNKAIKLYESALFKQVSVRKAYYPGVETREDALVYSLSLT